MFSLVILSIGMSDYVDELLFSSQLGFSGSVCLFFMILFWNHFFVVVVGCILNRFKSNP